jgi:SPP1 family predicted phage head-tail adaptor
MIDINFMLKEIGVLGTFQRATVVSGGYTGDTTTWSTLIQDKVCLENLSGEEIIAADKKGIQATHRIYYKVADIQEKDRVLINNKYYQITWVDNPMNMGKFLEIYAKRSDNYGSQSS